MEYEIKKTEEIPHLIIGTGKLDNLFSEKENLWINKFKKWGIIVAVSLVVLYAAYLIFLG